MGLSIVLPSGPGRQILQQVPAFPCCNVMFLFAFITGLRHWWDPGTSICRAAEDVQLAPNQLHLHPASTAIIAEGGIVMDDLQNLPEALCLVFGLSYASHLDCRMLHIWTTLKHEKHFLSLQGSTFACCWYQTHSSHDEGNLPAHDQNDEVLKAGTYVENKFKPLEAWYVQYADKSHKCPQLTLPVAGQPVSFWGDSGAARSVVHSSAVPANKLKMSGNHVYSVGASGRRWRKS